MKARLRDHLPLRFKNAVTLARRALQCERLEPRCLMHALPLASGFQVAETDSLLEQPESSVGALVQQPLTQDPPSAPVSLAAPSPLAAISSDARTLSGDAHQDDNGQVAAQTAGDDNIPQLAASPIESGEASDEKKLVPSDKKLPAEPIDLGGLEAEGEGQVAPAVGSFHATGSVGSLAGGSNSTSLGDDSVPARASAPLGDVDSSLSAGRVAGAPDGQTDRGALTDRQSNHTSSNVAITNSLSLSNDDALNPGITGAHASKASGSTQGIGLSLSPDVQAHSNLSPSSLSPNLQAPSVPVRSLQSQSDLSSPWIFSSVKPASTAAAIHWSFSSNGLVVDATRSMGSDDADLTSTHVASDSTDRATLAAEAAEMDDTGNALYALRVAIEQLSRERHAKRVGASDGLRHETARHANGSTLQTYLRVRQGSDGLVELAVEHSPTLDDHSPAYAGEQTRAAAGSNWSGASMGLYREFDLATVTDEPSTDFTHSAMLPVSSAGLAVDDSDALQAIDAAHADDGSADSVGGGEATLPLSLLALSSLLAVSRHRFARKQRQD